MHERRVSYRAQARVARESSVPFGGDLTLLANTYTAYIACITLTDCMKNGGMPE